MGEISLEASSVSRFIVSLSKSIQALCHGCMDFDDSIQMMGYININIDSGKTIDCVLNEKVRKSAANSMTCISNSFQAKKEKPKQTKDGSCSPMPVHEYSYHPSPQKRPYRNEFNSQRGAPRKKHRYYAKPVLPYSEQYTSSDNAFHEQSGSTSEFTDPELQVKIETHDTALQVQDSDNMASTSTERFFVKEEHGDLPGTEANDEMQAVQDNLRIPSETSNTEQSYNSVIEQEHINMREEQNKVKQIDNSNIETESSFLGSSSDGFHDTHVADSQQPHGSQDDTGDDQFEVIEIGDEDEDVQGLFDQTEYESILRQLHKGQRGTYSNNENSSVYPHSLESMRMARHHQDHRQQHMLSTNALYQWTSNHNFPSSSQYLEYMERERRKQLAKLYRSNRTIEQRERDRRLARMRQRRRRARLREQPEPEEAEVDHFIINQPS